jgi:tRNA(Phe) wybutosine-synthesizing methylase Tyw3
MGTNNKKGKAAVPYDDLDATIVTLVRALNRYPGVMTVGSCGGHEVITTPSQWSMVSFLKAATMIAMPPHHVCVSSTPARGVLQAPPVDVARASIVAYGAVRKR